LGKIYKSDYKKKLMADEKVKEAEEEKAVEATPTDVEALNPTVKRDWTEEMKVINAAIKAKSEATYNAFITEAEAKGMSEKETVSKVHDIYRKALDEVSIESYGRITQIWKQTEVSPIPIYEERLRQCESPDEFAQIGDTLKKYSRNQLSYPEDLVRSWCQTFLDGEEIDTDGLVRFHHRTGTHFIEELIQDAYAKFARDNDNRHLMHELINRSRILPNQEEMETVGRELAAAGRFDEIEVLEYVLQRRVKNLKYNLYSSSAESALDYLKG
jgi:hypothetical protein